MRKDRTIIPAMVGAALAGCDAGTPTDRTSGVITPAAIDTIVSTEDGTIGLVADMTVAPDGKLWIADARNHALLVFDSTSSELQSIAREGDGPGELRAPQALSSAGDGISVLQPQSARLSRFSFDGSFLESRAVPSGVLVPVALAADSLIAYPSLGLDGSLVARVDLQTGERMLLGQALAGRPSVMSMSSVRDQALRGEYPVEFRNNIFTVAASDGRVWSISHYTGAITAFTAQGDTTWSSSIGPDVLTRAHSAYFNAVRENPNRIHVPSVVADASMVGEELWVSFADANAGSVVQRIDSSSGEMLGRINLPSVGVGPFAVSPDVARLYVVDSDNAVLMSVALTDKR